MPRYFEVLDRLDVLISRPPQSIDYDSELRPLLENKYARRYFYDGLPKSVWISYLQENGIYLELSGTDGTEETMPSPWYELEPLLRFGGDEPDLTMEILQSLPSSQNPYVLERKLGIARVLVKASPNGFREWLADEIDELGSADYIHPNTLSAAVDLVLALAEDDCSIATEMAYAVFHLASPDSESKTESGALRTDKWNFDEELERCLSGIASDCGLPALELAVLLLEKSASTEYIDGWAFLSCPDLTGDSINESSDVVLRLVGAAKEVSESLALRIGLQVVRFLENRDFATAERIALHIRSMLPSIDPKGTELLLADHSKLANPVLYRELISLLSSRFETLPQKTLASYFEFVGALASKEEQRAYLEPIRENLSLEWSEYLGALNAELPATGVAEAELTEGVVWIGPSSPFTVEQMIEMPTDKLVNALNSWDYKPGWREPEPEGLARELAKFAAENASTVAANAMTLENLVQPTWVRGIVQGLANAVKEGTAISWDPVLKFCKWAVGQERGEELEGSGLEQFDRTWGPARKEIARLLRHGTTKPSAEIPFSHKDQVWELLEILIQDPNPTAEEEAERAEYSDPATSAINTTRGVTLGAIFSYALWVSRHDPQETHSWASYGLEGTQAVLEKVLAEESSNAVRSLFGKWLPYVFWLDQVWTKHNVDKIVPLNTPEIWASVWDSYLMFSSTLYLEFLDLLRPSYERAIQNMGTESPEKTRPANPTERLGSHLALFYRAGILKLDDPLFFGFFQKADEKLRYNMMAGAVRQVQEIPTDRREAAIVRLQDLWKWRLSATIDERADEYHELSSFAWWFLKDDFDLLWRLQQQQRIQEQGIELDLDGLVLEKLAEMAADHLEEVLSCLEAIVKNPASESWGIYDDHVKAILSAGLSSDDSGLHDKAENLVHYIGSLGYLSFRNLLDGINADGLVKEEPIE